MPFARRPFRVVAPYLAYDFKRHFQGAFALRRGNQRRAFVPHAAQKGGEPSPWRIGAALGHGTRHRSLPTEVLLPTRRFDSAQKTRKVGRGLLRLRRPCGCFFRHFSPAVPQASHRRETVSLCPRIIRSAAGTPRARHSLENRRGAGSSGSRQ